MDWNTERFQASFEKFLKLPRAYRLAAFPLLAVVVFAAYGYFLYKPLDRQLDNAQNKRKQLEVKLSQVRESTANMERLQQEIADLEQQLKLALRQLPDSKELPVLLTDITSLGKNAGLEVKAFRPQAEIRRDFYAEVPIEIEFSGSYHDIASFFDRVARLPRIVNVGQLELKIKEETAFGTTLTVKGSATTFRFIEPPKESEQEKGRKGTKRHRGHRRGKAGKGGAA